MPRSLIKARIKQWSNRESEHPLDLSDTHLETLPELPSGLTQLNCSWNRLTGLASQMPIFDKLIYLECSNNQIACLPPLPQRLRYLYCNSNQLTSLPLLPPSLTTLQCCSNTLAELPPLPSTLCTLYCAYNQLTMLPLVLPLTLTYLECSQNRLTALPPLPPHLTDLYCSDNRLTMLPDLPAELTQFACSRNLLEVLPPTVPLGFLRPATLIHFKTDGNYFPAALRTESIDVYWGKVRSYYEAEQCRSKERIVARCAYIFEELMRCMWCPERVMRLIRMGIVPEDM